MKNTLRIGTFICIVMFLLIPILSSSVIAAVTATVDAKTDNTSSGPTVSTVTGWPSTTIAAGDDGSGVLIVYCACYQIDTNPGGTGSDHYIELNVQLSTGGPIYQASLFSTLAAGTSIFPYPTTISVTVPYTAGPPPETFNVWVYAECKDLQTSTKVWNTWSCTVTT